MQYGSYQQALFFNLNVLRQTIMVSVIDVILGDLRWRSCKRPTSFVVDVSAGWWRSAREKLLLGNTELRAVQLFAVRGKVHAGRTSQKCRELQSAKTAFWASRSMIWDSRCRFPQLQLTLKNKHEKNKKQHGGRARLSSISGLITQRRLRCSNDNFLTARDLSILC